MYTEPLYASMFQMLNCNLYKVVEKVETSQVGWGGGGHVSLLSYLLPALTASV